MHGHALPHGVTRLQQWGDHTCNSHVGNTWRGTSWRRCLRASGAEDQMQRQNPRSPHYPVRIEIIFVQNGACSLQTYAYPRRDNSICCKYDTLCVCIFSFVSYKELVLSQGYLCSWAGTWNKTFLWKKFFSRKYICYIWAVELPYLIFLFFSIYLILNYYSCLPSQRVTTLKKVI